MVKQQKDERQEPGAPGGAPEAGGSLTEGAGREDSTGKNSLTLGTFPGPRTEHPGKRATADGWARC